jgi:hypothetical protein
MALFIWFIIRLIQLVFLARTVFFSHKKSVNSVFQSAYNSSRRGKSPDYALYSKSRISSPETAALDAAAMRSCLHPIRTQIPMTNKWKWALVLGLGVGFACENGRGSFLSYEFQPTNTDKHQHSNRIYPRFLDYRTP